MSSDIAIRVEGLSKCYQIYDTPRDRLKQFVFPRIQGMLGLKPQTYFREFWALKEVSFLVKRGETVGIIGRNGSGKSTLLQIICGTLTPSSGEVETFGRVAALLELGSGFNPEFTGRENVYMNGAVLGLSEKEVTDRFDDIIAFADIGDFIDQPVKMYSSGMMVRLAFAVAINVDPQILIVDEALSVGDELFQRKCFSRIEAIKKNGATILFVSHSGGTVVELCDQAILLDAGEKLAMGAPKVMVGKYQKLLYAPLEKRVTIRDEICKNDTKLTFECDVNEKNIKLNVIDKIENDQDDYYDENLVPKSTFEYESHGTYIEQPEIYSLENIKVNILQRGKSYRYVYRVRFKTATSYVRFGMMIKTTTGLELGGATSAANCLLGIPSIEKGSIYRVDFKFSCDLNPGTYFLNAGVTGLKNESEIYLHRVLDICMFKVLPENEDTATSLIDFKCKPFFHDITKDEI